MLGLGGFLNGGGGGGFLKGGGGGGGGFLKGGGGGGGGIIFGILGGGGGFKDGLNFGGVNIFLFLEFLRLVKLRFLIFKGLCNFCNNLFY